MSTNALVKASETMSEMIQDRGFVCTREEVKQFFSTFTDESKHKKYKHVQDNSELVLLLIQRSDKNIRKQPDFLKGLSLLTGTNSMIVITIGPNDEMNANDWYKYPDERVTIFDLYHIQQNITKHVMVPLHELADQQEVDYIRKIYSLDSLTDLPLIDRYDPVIRYHGWKSGSVCKITRHPRLCPTAAQHIGSGVAQSISYRFIVKN